MDEKEKEVVEELSQGDFVTRNLLSRIFMKMKKWDFHRLCGNLRARPEKGRAIFGLCRQRYRMDLDEFINAILNGEEEGEESEDGWEEGEREDVEMKIA